MQELHQLRSVRHLSGRQEGQHRTRNRQHRDRQDKASAEDSLSSHVTSLTFLEEDLMDELATPVAASRVVSHRASARWALKWKRTSKRSRHTP